MLEFTRHISINGDNISEPNLVKAFDEEDLKKIGEAVVQGYESDEQSRFTWMRRMEAGMDLAMLIQKEKNFPWPNCSNVIFPLISTSALQFSARAYPNLIQGLDIVKYRVVGSDPTDQITKMADRISKHMSWQVLEEDMSWEEQHDRLLINLAVVGTNFIKTYFSPSLGHNVSELVLARDFVLDYYAKSVEGCSRKTQIVPFYSNEIYERVKRGTFKDVLNSDWFAAGPPVPDPQYKKDQRQGMNPPQKDDDTPWIALEQHRLLDLDGDGYAEPYIVTVEKSSHEVLRIVSRIDRIEDVELNSAKEIIRINPTEYFTKYSFIPSMDGGVYDIGFGVFLGPINESVNSGINQIIDCGTMNNANGGFLGRGAKIRGGSSTFAPWEWKRVDSTGDDLRKNIVPFETREPSNVMFQMISLLIDYARQLAGTTDITVGENPGQNTPAETSRNMTENGLQVYTMVFKRIWRSMKEEFKKRHRLNATYLPSKQHFGSSGDWVTAEDYKSNSDLVVPAADPNLTSAGQRMQQAMLVTSRSTGVPGYSVPEAEKMFLKAARVENIDKIYPGPDKVPPLPNPKVQIENLKLQGRQKEFAHQQQMLLLELMSEREESAARVIKLKAEAMKLASEAKGEEAERRLKAFDSVVDAMEAHHNILNKRIELMMKGAEDGGGSGSESSGTGTGIPGMAGAPQNQGAMGGTPNVEGQPAGPVG